MSKQTIYDKVDILGVDIDAITQTEAIDYIINRAGDPTSPAIYVVKPYVEFLDKAAKDDSIKELLNRAELVLADGIALVWAAAWLYAGPRTFRRFTKSLIQIVTSPKKLYWPLDKPLAGINFAWPMLQAAAAKQLRIYLVGSPKNEQTSDSSNATSTDAITHVAETVQRQITGIKIVGVHNGNDNTQPRGKASRAWINRLSDQIDAADADLILVGMGFPLQEEVMSVLASQLKHGVLVGEGGTFDYEQFGGTRAKAPAFVQRIGMEWFWRLILEPKRIIRQLAVPRFIIRVWRSR